VKEKERFGMAGRLADVVRLTPFEQTSAKLQQMRTVAVLAAVVAALAAGTASLGAAAGSQQPAKAQFWGAIAPSWSPNGKQIAFASVRYVSRKNCCGLPPSFDAKSYRIERTSSNPGGAMHTVLHSDGYCCEQMLWASGGRILLNPNVGLKSVGALGEKSKRLVFPSCAGKPERGHKCQTVGFFLSPNREYAAAAITADSGDPHVDQGIGLVKVEPDGKASLLPTALTADEQAGQIYDRPLAFSPDGTQLVFSRTSWDGWTGGPLSLMAIPVEGGGEPVPLAQSAIPGASSVPSDVQQVQWSPDGRWIAFVESESLEVVPTTGGPPRVLPSCGNAANYWVFSWSATSQEIAYGCFDYDAAKEAGSRWTVQFSTVRPDGTDLVDLLKDRPLAYVGGAQWSPDGSRLLFMAHKVSHRAVQIWTARADGSDLARMG
jgi:hypothetical protein